MFPTPKLYLTQIIPKYQLSWEHAFYSHLVGSGNNKDWNEVYRKIKETEDLRKNITQHTFHLTIC